MTTENETLRKALEDAKEKLQEQNELLERLTAVPLPYATIVAIHENADPKSMTVVSSGNFIEILKPDFPCTIGDTITLSGATQQAVDGLTMQAIGETAIVRAVFSDGITEIDHQASTKLVLTGDNLGKAIEPGDKVVLDRTATVIVKNLGKDKTQFNITNEIDVYWDDIGGLEEAKKLLIEAIELPHKYPHLYEYYHKRPVKGILLYGAPGCGKTLLGRATATSLKTIYSCAGSGFIYVKAPEILNKYVGNSEATIRQIFQRASDFKHDYGFPAVIFIDEADAILSKRGSGKSSDMESTIVPMFLAEMDGMNSSDAVVLLATNRIDKLDNAVIREGRVDYKIKITRPNQDNVRAIFMVHMRNLPIAPAFQTDQLISLACAELFSEERPLYNIHTNDGVINFDLRHVLSGSMVANVVDRASMTALRRDIMSDSKTGINLNDMIMAVDGVYESNQDVDYKDDLLDFTSAFRQDVRHIEKVKV